MPRPDPNINWNQAISTVCGYAALIAIIYFLFS